LALLLVKRAPERDLLGAGAQERRPVAVVAPHEPPHEQDRHEDEHDQHAERAEQERPAAEVLEVELLQLFGEVHLRASETRVLRFSGAASSDSPAAARCDANRVNWAPGPAFVPVWMTLSSGADSDSEESMLRMKADTRVLDCATPLNSIFFWLCLTDVRYTPS